MPFRLTVREQRGHDGQRTGRNGSRGSRREGNARRRGSWISGPERVRDQNISQGTAREEQHRLYGATPDGIEAI